MRYFTQDELTVTGTGLANIPGQDQSANLQLLVTKLLDPVREMWGKPITVNSGFRSLEVNNKVNGAATSQHMKGQAADITCDDNKSLYKMIMENFEFDQLINEHNYSWIHVSYRLNNNRNQAFSIT